MPSFKCLIMQGLLDTNFRAGKHSHPVYVVSFESWESPLKINNYEAVSIVTINTA